MLKVSLVSSPSTSAETPKSWAGVLALGEAGGAGPTTGVQGQTRAKLVPTMLGKF